MKNRFYLACLRDNVGSNMAFHAINGLGYTTDVNKAHVYTRQEAQQAWERGRLFDMPISAEHVDALTCWKVDCQLLPCESDFSQSENGYFAFRSQRWDGNDVYWLSLEGPTLNVRLAKKFTLNEAKKLGEDVVVVPIGIAKQHERKTFDHHLLDRRTMIQGAGLVMPGHIRRARRRKPNPHPKTRFNCPSCGKINWQHNPHDFHGCNDVFCDAH
jgi:hypothetical protein